MVADKAAQLCLCAAYLAAVLLGLLGSCDPSASRLYRRTLRSSRRCSCSSLDISRTRSASIGGGIRLTPSNQVDTVWRQLGWNNPAATAMDSRGYHLPLTLRPISPLTSPSKSPHTSSIYTRPCQGRQVSEQAPYCDTSTVSMLYALRRSASPAQGWRGYWRCAGPSRRSWRCLPGVRYCTRCS